MKFIKKLMLLVGVLLTLASCSDGVEEMVPMEWESDLPSVTVIYSVSGPGDNGYVDLMVKGISHFTDSTNVEIHTLAPKSMEEARKQFDQWLQSTQGKDRKHLLILGGSDYEVFLDDCPDMTGQNRTVLMVESEKQDLPQGVCTAIIDREGPMYLAGALCARTAAYIVAATPQDKVLARAINAFRMGYEKYSGGMPLEPVHYLSDGWDGYMMTFEAYSYITDVLNDRMSMAFEAGDIAQMRHIVVPLAGFSNTSIYYHAVQNNFGLASCQAVVGMDVDFSDRVDMAPFSVVLRLDDLLTDNINRWLAGEELPSHHTYTMHEGYSDVVLNPNFNMSSFYNMEEIELPEEEGGGTTLVYLAPDYWQRRYEELKSILHYS